MNRLRKTTGDVGRLLPVVWLAVALSVHAEADEKPAVEPVSLVAFGDVDPALVEHAAAWAADNLAIPVPVAEPAGLEGESLEDAVTQAKQRVAEDSLGLVVFVRPTSGETVHGFMRPDDRVVIVNVGGLSVDDPETTLLEKRLERQAIRGTSMLMGLDPSPNPFSAMYNYQSLEDLDKIGRNLDPPWLKKLQQAADAKGIPVDPESRFYLLQ